MSTRSAIAIWGKHKYRQIIKACNFGMCLVANRYMQSRHAMAKVALILLIQTLSGLVL